MTETNETRSPELEGRVAIPAWWRGIVERHGPRDFVLKEGRDRASYAEIDARSAALARGLLADGAGKGTRIGILMQNGPDWVASWLAVSRIGGVAIAQRAGTRRIGGCADNNDLGAVRFEFQVVNVNLVGSEAR